MKILGNASQDASFKMANDQGLKTKLDENLCSETMYDVAQDERRFSHFKHMKE